MIPVQWGIRYVNLIFLAVQDKLLSHGRTSVLLNPLLLQEVNLWACFSLRTSPRVEKQPLSQEDSFPTLQCVEVSSHACLWHLGRLSTRESTLPLHHVRIVSHNVEVSVQCSHQHLDLPRNQDSRSSSTNSKYPFLAAACSGIHPESPLIFGFFSSFRISRSLSTSPRWATLSKFSAEPA